MLTDFTGAAWVYITYDYTELRYGIDGLAAKVQQEFNLGPFTKEEKIHEHAKFQRSPENDERESVYCWHRG